MNKKIIIIGCLVLTAALIAGGIIFFHDREQPAQPEEELGTMTILTPEEQEAIEQDAEAQNQIAENTALIEDDKTLESQAEIAASRRAALCYEIMSDTSEGTPDIRALIESHLGAAGYGVGELRAWESDTQSLAVSLNAALPGDLVCITDDNGGYSPVGVFLFENKVAVLSSGTVAIRNIGALGDHIGFIRILPDDGKSYDIRKTEADIFGYVPPASLTISSEMAKKIEGQTSRLASFLSDHIAQKPHTTREIKAEVNDIDTASFSGVYVINVSVTGERAPLTVFYYPDTKEFSFE